MVFQKKEITISPKNKEYEVCPFMSNVGRKN